MAGLLVCMMTGTVFCNICDTSEKLMGPALTKRSLLAAGEIKPEGRRSARTLNEKRA